MKCRLHFTSTYGYDEHVKTVPDVLEIRGDAETNHL